LQKKFEMSKIQALKALLKDNKTGLVLSFVIDNPEVLREKDDQDVTGLLLIAYQSNKETLQKLVNLVNDFNFYEAIVCGKKSEVKLHLEEHPEFINTHSPDGFTPVALACYFENVDIANFLVEKGADPNIQANNGSGINALHAAVAKNNYELCNLLIENGAGVNAVQIQKVTALHSAAHRGNLSIVKLLIENGANANAKMDNGDTALSIADRDGHLQVKQYLESLSTANQ
jgi:ankyrin repeat protein